MVDNALELAKTKGEGIIDYVWHNSVITAVEKKRSFIRRENGSLPEVGFYTQQADFQLSRPFGLSCRIYFRLRCHFSLAYCP